MEQSAYLSCLSLQEGHLGQQAVAVTGLRVEVITHSAKQVGCFFQVLVGLIQQTCSWETHKSFSTECTFHLDYSLAT